MTKADQAAQIRALAEKVATWNFNLVRADPGGGAAHFRNTDFWVGSREIRQTGAGAIFVVDPNDANDKAFMILGHGWSVADRRRLVGHSFVVAIGYLGGADKHKPRFCFGNPQQLVDRKVLTWDRPMYRSGRQGRSQATAAAKLDEAALFDLKVKRTKKGRDGFVYYMGPSRKPYYVHGNDESKVEVGVPTVYKVSDRPAFGILRVANRTETRRFREARAAEAEVVRRLEAGEVRLGTDIWLKPTDVVKLPEHADRRDLDEVMDDLRAPQFSLAAFETSETGVDDCPFCRVYNTTAVEANEARIDPTKKRGWQIRSTGLQAIEDALRPRLLKRGFMHFKVSEEIPPLSINIWAVLGIDKKTLCSQVQAAIDDLLGKKKKQVENLTQDPPYQTVVTAVQALRKPPSGPFVMLWPTRRELIEAAGAVALRLAPKDPKPVNDPDPEPEDGGDEGEDQDNDGNEPEVDEEEETSVDEPVKSLDEDGDESEDDGAEATEVKVFSADSGTHRVATTAPEVVKRSQAGASPS